MRLRLNHHLVVDFISTNAGEDACKILRCIDNGLTDEQISSKTKLKVNDIRAALNKLHYMGIIVYSKEKAKNSNWYTYTWFVKRDRIAELLEERYKEELEKLEQKLKFEHDYIFFKCVNGCEKLPFELAYEYNFRCPECGKEMEEQDNATEKDELDTKIKEIQKFLAA
jgi:transcription initiation factor TFIIE subunit alpha